jgi:LacI family transcriptional regulator
VKKRKVSQQQIAKDLGLSQTLVSMVLNGRKNGVSADSYSKIWKHAKVIGYQPKGMKLSDQAEEAGTVGFILRSGIKLDTTNRYFSHVQHGLHQALSAKGHSLIFLGYEDLLDARSLEESFSPNRSMRGIALLGEVKLPFLHALRQMESRIVSVGAQYPGLCHSVQPNEQQAAEQLVEHLVSLGHKTFGWIGGMQGMQRGRYRMEAVMSALRLRNISIQRDHFMEFVKADRGEGREAACRFLMLKKKKQRPTALICFNSLIARGAVTLLQQSGVRVPEEVSVVSMDRSGANTEDHPFMTRAGADPEKLGYFAGEMILKSEGAHADVFSDLVISSEITLGESSGNALVV